MNDTNEQTLWTPELAAETKAWMPFLSMRPWFEDSHVFFASSTDPFGPRYASLFAASTESVDDPTGLAALPDDAVLVWTETSPDASFKTFSRCKRVFLGASSASGWTREEFESRVQDVFPGRAIRFFGQSPEWPYRLLESYPEASQWYVAVADEPLPSWPSLGLAMPTVDCPHEVREAILSLQRTYPGLLEIALVANGSSSETLEHLRQTAADLPNVTLLESPANLGYGQGCNRGLEFLATFGLDYCGVINDDVIPDSDCLGELVWSMKSLESLGLKPGAIGPVSNNIHGLQQVDIGPIESYAGLLDLAHAHHSAHASSVTQVRQLRGLCLVFHPQLLQEVGGFDPCFGIGNFEDDDHNLRTHLAGYTLWIADGAFLFHHGSTTFRRLQIDYQANIARNAETMAHKWGLSDVGQWIGLAQTPRGVSLQVPLDSWKSRENFAAVTINGEAVDLVRQASDMEFAAWMIQAMRERPRSDRQRILEALKVA